ncbi:M20 metallopeptidase family protein [Micromonospora mirobrigensis]|uniref:Hippurate hydrolase n=1 Tax=Micromonospora mirobrigensis TaxID=262898 RepID=A0A1C4WET2_9ACTN|nr:M20 family metallopeptidase [Micromonospora mirobrigensis]SCE94441.1 hippurate hydrolase [Micromonospora mirobrigensis]
MASPSVDLAGLPALAERRRAPLTELYRRLHRHPELGLRLPLTQAAVLDALRPLSLEVRTGTTSSAVVARLAGRGDGPPVLLRADMDALPLAERTGLPYASEVAGAMHACGHDAHTAMLVEAAHLIAAARPGPPGDVILMFQPGEEGHDGARTVLADGLLDGDFAPARAYALHQVPGLPSGSVTTRPGPLLAGADGLTVTVRGVGGHVALPHLGADPVPVLCAIVLAVQQMVTRRFNVFDPVVVTVNRLDAGTPGAGIIPDTATAQGTVRTFSDAARALVTEALTTVATGVAAAHGCTAEVRIDPGYPPTVNDAAEARWALDAVAGVLGHDRVSELPTPIPASEDFAYLLQRTPGAMLILGTRPADGPVAPVHSAEMRLDEAALTAGVAALAALALTPRH